MARFNIDDNLQDVAGNIDGLAGAVTSAIPQIGKLRSAWVAFNATFVASPVGAIIAVVVGAIALLGEGLSRFQPFLDGFDRVWSSVGTGISVAADNLLIFLGILDGSRRSVIDAARATALLTRRTQELRDRRIEFIETEAELNRQLQEVRATAGDVTLSDQERITALSEARLIQDELFRERIAQAEEEATIARELAALTNNNAEANEELARAEAAVIDLRAAQSAANLELIGQLTGLELAERNRQDQLIAAQSSGIFQDRANADEEEIARLTRLGAGVDILAQVRLTASQERLSILDNELAIAEEAGESENQLQIRRLALIQAETDARKAASDVRIAIADAEMQTERETTDAAIGLAGQLGDTLTSLAGDNKGLAIAGLLVGQATSIASAIIDTVRANAAAVAASPLTAGQPFVAINTISAGLGIATAIGATVQGIQQINAAGGPSPTGGGAQSASFGGVSLAQPSVNSAPPQLDNRMISQMQPAEASPTFILEGERAQADARARKRARKLKLRRNG